MGNCQITQSSAVFVLEDGTKYAPKVDYLDYLCKYGAKTAQGRRIVRIEYKHPPSILKPIEGALERFKRETAQMIINEQMDSIDDFEKEL